MRKSLWSGGMVVLCLVAPLRAAPPTPKLVQETWDAAYIEGAKCGYVHTSVHEINQDGQKILRINKSMHLQIKRYKNVVSLRMDVCNDETPEGKVVGVSLTQYTDTGVLLLTGTVEGDSVVLRSSNDRTENKVPWDDKVLGMARQESLFADKKVKPGDKLEVLSFEPALPATLKVKAVVKPAEEVDLLVTVEDGTATRPQRAKNKQERVEALSDKVALDRDAIHL